MSSPTTTTCSSYSAMAPNATGTGAPTSSPRRFPARQPTQAAAVAAVGGWSHTAMLLDTQGDITERAKLFKLRPSTASGTDGSLHLMPLASWPCHRRIVIPSWVAVTILADAVRPIISAGGHLRVCRNWRPDGSAFGACCCAGKLRSPAHAPQARPHPARLQRLQGVRQSYAKDAPQVADPSCPGGWHHRW